MNVGLITLGCSKNQVDSEMILGLFKNNGYNIVSDPSIADIIVVNTCGFIESAKKEAIDTIFEMADYKAYGNCSALIVVGCLAKRYKKEILKTMPEVDLCIGVDEYDHIGEILSDFFNHKMSKKELCFNERVVSTKFPSCYIRIADGCDNRCSYCAIPLIRGNFKSRTIEDIVEEVSELAKKGMSEFNLIAQDTTRYGLDIYSELSLTKLLKEISKIGGVKWIRILYMYIYEITPELIDEIKTNDKICKYFDIPIQHINEEMLKSMNRHDTKEKIITTIEKVKSEIPDAILRTTLITGFPGETEEMHIELLDYIKETEFDRLGAFTYSKEEDTRAYSLDSQINEKVKNKRLKEIFEIQKDISYSKNKDRVGKVYEVLVEDVSDSEEYFVCRSMYEAPDVDGKIYVKITEESCEEIVVSGYVKVKIVDANDYDLFAEVIKER